MSLLCSQESFHFCVLISVARSSIGFTESNQVHFFVNSLTKSLNDELVVEWLEFPWSDKKQYIDAMVYSPKNKTVFYIEAKRFSHKSKVASISRDIECILTADRGFMSEHRINNIENEYVIALSDVWLETKWKKSIPTWWESDETNSFKSSLKENYNID